MIKKIISFGIKTAYLALIICFFTFPFLASAQTTCPDGKYCALSTIPGITETGKPVDPSFLIKNIYGISIGIAAVLAIGMIIWAGIQYATTEAITGKSEAKKHWVGAFWGLLLLISSYLILKTINVNLVDQDLSLGTATGCTETGPSGEIQPCGVAATEAILQKTRDNLVAEKLAIIQRQDTLRQEIDNLELQRSNLEEEGKLDEAYAIQQQIDVKQSELSYTAINLQSNAAYTVITSTAARGDLEFNRVVSNWNSADAGKVITAYQQDFTDKMNAIRTMKDAAGNPLYPQDRIDTMQAQFNYQLAYMNNYKAWRDSGGQGSVPQKPAFNLGLVFPETTQ